LFADGRREVGGRFLKNARITLGEESWNGTSAQRLSRQRHEQEANDLRVKVFVTPREGILDPPGKAVEQSLRSLGFKEVAGVKIGRYILLDIDVPTAEQARAAAQKMCEQLLANPLIEDFRLELDGG
jgi:phosphoribosylformylglycinamidine synthase subunit PurS